ncbi:MAG TPA: DUF1800 domain-containing protein [Mycobacteriales bacterium]|nr:DUF1800 domain-containing protein [Mycobacteriales bacterium]
MSEVSSPAAGAIVGRSVLGRRGLLAAAAGGVAVTAIPTATAAAVTTGRARPRSGVPVTVPDDHALHALRRLGYGPTPADLATVRSMGTSAWLAKQLAGGKDLHETLLALQFPLLTMAPARMAQAYAADSYEAIQAYEWATLSRTIFSENQVLARLGEVWLDHFNVCSLVEKQFLPWTRFSYDTEVVRPRAAGSFAELLAAVLTAPAMLTYLDQWLSNKEYPVENLAREDLELHTVGLGHFTERDVKAYAKLLTGATINPTTWEYEYNPALHYTGHLEIVGFKTANRSANGEHLIRDFAEYLAHRPATARTVARRLLVHYVSDTPSASLIDRVARHYLRNGTEIGSTLRFIVEQDEFFASRGQKARRPGDTFAAAVRGMGWTWGQLPDLGATSVKAVLSWGAYLNFLRAAGHVPSEWVAPNGYPDVGHAWLNSNTTLQTWQLMGWLANPGGTAPPFTRTRGPAAAAWHQGITVDGIIAAAAERITGQSVRREHRHAIAAIAGLDPHEQPSSAWRAGGTPAHGAIEFAILASEYMELR